jgi:hypothetical protein
MTKGFIFKADHPARRERQKPAVPHSCNRLQESIDAGQPTPQSEVSG